MITWGWLLVATVVAPTPDLPVDPTPDPPVAPTPDPPVARDATIVWEVGEGCPGKGELVEQIETFIGEPFDPANWPGIFVGVRIDRTDDGLWRARVALRSPGGETDQVFSSEICAHMVTVVAVEAALMLDTARTLQEWTARAPPAPKPPESRPEGDTEAAPAALPSAPPLRLGFDLGAGAWAGLSPGVTAVTALGFVLRYHSAELRLGGELLTPRFVGDDTYPDEGVRIWRGAAVLEACYIAGGRVEVPLCAGASGGAFVGKGVGVSNARQQHHPHVDARVRTGLTWWARPTVAFVVAFSGQLNLLESGFSVTGLGQVARTSPVALHATVGLEFLWDVERKTPPRATPQMRSKAPGP